MPTPEEEKKKKGSETTADTAPTSASEVKAQEKENLETATAEATPVETPVEQTEETPKETETPEQLNEVTEGQQTVLNQMHKAEEHPERRDNFSSSTTAPELSTDALTQERDKAIADAPYTSSFLRNNQKPTAPDPYDKRKENALRWQQGITLLGKLAGIIGDTVTASKRGVVTDKKDSQGKEEMDAVGTQIKSLRDAYNARYKTYLDAQTLYRKGLQSAADADIKAANEYRNKLLGRKIEKEYSWDKGFNAENVAALRNRNRGISSNGKIDPQFVPLVLSGGREAAVSKAAMKNFVPQAVRALMDDLRQMSNGEVPMDNGLLRELYYDFNLPAYNIDFQKEPEEWLKLLMQTNNITSAEATIKKMMIDDAGKGQMNYFLTKYLDETNNKDILDKLEGYVRMTTGRQDKGFLYKGDEDIMAKRKALTDLIYNKSIRTKATTYTDDKGKTYEVLEPINPNGYFNISPDVRWSGTGLQSAFNTRTDLESYINNLDRDVLYEICAQNGIIHTPTQTSTQATTPATQATQPTQTQPQGQHTEKKEEKKETPTEDKKESKSVTGEDLAKNLPSAKIKPQNDLSVSTFYRFLKRIKESANGDKAKFAQAFREKYKDATDAEINYAFGLNINN